MTEAHAQTSSLAGTPTPAVVAMSSSVMNAAANPGSVSDSNICQHLQGMSKLLMTYGAASYFNKYFNANIKITSMLTL